MCERYLATYGVAAVEEEAARVSAAKTVPPTRRDMTLA